MNNKIPTYLSENETQVVTRLQQRDMLAFAQLYDNYSATLYGVALKIVQSKEIAEQVIQDTFMKIWDNSASYDASKGRLYTWMLNITRNTAIDATRSRHFQHLKNTDAIEDFAHALGAECLNLDTIGLREVVQKMNKKYTILIDLIYFDQYTQIEAAEMIGIPLGTVKTRLRHALLELREVFAAS